MKTCLARQSLPGVVVYDRITRVHVRCRRGVPTLWRGRGFISWLWRGLRLLLKGIVGGILLLTKRRLLRRGSWAGVGGIFLLTRRRLLVLGSCGTVGGILLLTRGRLLVRGS